MWAISFRGIGNIVGARYIEPDWPLEKNENIKVEDDKFEPGMVLADNGKSLIIPTNPKVIPNELEELKLKVQLLQNQINTILK